MSCSEAISSSSGGVTDVLSDCGRAMVSDCVPPATELRAEAGRSGDDRLTNFSIEITQSLEYLPLTLETK